MLTGVVVSVIIFFLFSFSLIFIKKKGLSNRQAFMYFKLQD
jgi:hypothetical protein